MTNYMIRYYIFALFCSLLLACSNNPKPNTIKKTKSEVPKFNADSAYYFVEKQVSFGPRYISSKGWENCAVWLEKKFLQFKKLPIIIL